MSDDLLGCISKKDLELLKAFISENYPDLNDNCGATTPLNMAVRSGSLDIFSYLIEQGCDVNLCDENGETPLIYACVKGNLEISKQLIEKGSDVNKQSKSGLSAFHLACKSGNTELIDLLIEKGADIHAVNNEGKNAYYFATKIETMTFLHNNNVSLNVVDKDGLSPVLFCAKNGHYPKFSFILENIKDYDPNEATKSCETAILFCSESQLYQQELMVADLIKLGADVNKKSKYGMSPLHNCASNNHVKIATAILDHVDENNRPIAHIDVIEPAFAHTPLQLACGNGHLDMIKLLLLKGADINFVNPLERTALDVANNACCKNEEIISFLVSNGAISGSAVANAAASKELDDVKMVVMQGLNQAGGKEADVSKQEKKKRCVIM